MYVFGVWVVCNGLVMVIGLMVGGVLVMNFGWCVVFWVVVLVSVVIMVLVVCVVLELFDVVYCCFDVLV